MNAYFAILIFIVLGLLVGSVPIMAGHFLNKKKPNPAKNAAYECGIPAEQSARLPFDVRYYLVAILFILFDLETAFLFPWAVSLRQIGNAGFYAMLIFIGILLIGFLYEWSRGALEWE